MLASGLAASTASRPEYIVEKKTEIIAVSELQYADTGAYVSLTLPGSTSQLMNVGEPVLPRITRIYQLPFQSQNI
ncbi:MAG: hypothetical protein BV459_05585, partial [Thermoplasmata archaeon M11B2D]